MIKSEATVLRILKQGGDISCGNTGWFLYYADGSRKRLLHRTVVSMVEKKLIHSTDKMASPIKLNYSLNHQKGL